MEGPGGKEAGAKPRGGAETRVKGGAYRSPGEGRKAPGGGPVSGVDECGGPQAARFRSGTWGLNWTAGPKSARFSGAELEGRDGRLKPPGASGLGWRAGTWDRERPVKRSWRAWAGPGGTTASRADCEGHLGMEQNHESRRQGSEKWARPDVRVVLSDGCDWKGCALGATPVSLRRPLAPQAPSPAADAFLHYRTSKVRALRAARLERLVRELVSGDHEQDPGFVPAFLATHRAFVSTARVLGLLLPPPPPPLPPGSVPMGNLRVPTPRLSPGYSIWHSRPLSAP